VAHQFCGECGAARIDGAAFCRECGAQLADAAPGPGPGLISPVAPPAAPPAARRGRRRTYVALGVAGVVLLASTGVVVALTVGGDDDTEAAGGTTRTATAAHSIDNGASLLAEPSRSWVAMADDVLPGGTVSSMRQWDGATEAESLVLADAVVIQVAGDERTVLAALDPDDGDVMWQQPAGDYGVDCWAVADDTALVCTDVDDGTLRLLDPMTGDTRGTAESPGWSLDVYSSSSVIYAAGAKEGNDEDHQIVTVAAFSTDRLAPRWSRDLPGGAESDPDDPNLFDAGVFVDSVPTGIDVSYGPYSWEVDPGSGKVTSQSDRWADGTSPDDIRQGYRTEWEDVGDTTRLRVTDLEGNTLLSAPGDPWSATGWGYVQNGTIGIGPTLYDLATGSELWTRDDLYVLDEYGTGPNWSWTADGRWILADDQSQPGESTAGTSLLDARSGTTLWHADTVVSEWNSVFTADAVATAGQDAVLTVRPAAAGDTAWTAPLDAVTTDVEGPTYSLGITSDTLAVVGQGGVTGFVGFDAAPGTSAPGTDIGDDDGTDDDSETGPAYVTECGSEPEFTPVESTAANGGLTITFTVTAICPDGQWLSSDGQWITVSTTADAADGVQTYAAGSFDFSDDPIWVPGSGSEPTTVTIVYPYSHAFATPDEINAAITQQIILVECVKAPGSTDGAVPSDPSYGADPEVPVVPTGEALDATQVSESALAALQRIAAADDADVAASLEGLWMPQLSSKLYGTRDDGISYRYEDILAEHLRLRLRYPDVRLVQSTDWKSFLLPDYWVTLVGQTSGRPGPALRWCDDQGFDGGHCYAKRLLRDGPNEGTTRNR
jgi:hypothetical protein